MTYPSFNVGDVLTASDMNAVGLWKINETTFTNQSSVNVDNVFSSTYRNYRVLITAHATGSVTRALRVKYRVGGTTTTGSDYYNKGWYNAGTLTGYAPAALDHWYVGDCHNNAQYPGYFVLDIFNVNQAARTGGVAANVESFGTGTFNINNTHAVATAYTGFNLSPNGDNITGTVRVYGYRD